MLAARPPRVRSQPSLRRRDAVTWEYRPPGSEAAFSRPLSRNKKISHRTVYGHATSKPANRRADVGLFVQIVTLPREAWAPGASPGTATGLLKMVASLPDMEVHTGPLSHPAWRTSRLSSSAATRASSCSQLWWRSVQAGFLVDGTRACQGPPYRLSIYRRTIKMGPHSKQPLTESQSAGPIVDHAGGMVQAACRAGVRGGPG